MSDNIDANNIKDKLTSLLTDVAEKARQDAIDGESDIGSIFRREGPELQPIDVKMIEAAIKNIERATATKEGAHRLMNGIMIAAATAARVL